MRHLFAGVLVAISVSSAVPAAAEPAAVTIEERARIRSGGDVVRLKVTTTCPAGAEVLEAFAYVTQDGNQSRFTPLPITCDGEPHGSKVKVPAQDFKFHRGDAHASGYVLLTSGESTSPSQELRLR